MQKLLALAAIVSVASAAHIGKVGHVGTVTLGVYKNLHVYSTPAPLVDINDASEAESIARNILAIPDVDIPRENREIVEQSIKREHEVVTRQSDNIAGYEAVTAPTIADGQISEHVRYDQNVFPGGNTDFRLGRSRDSAPVQGSLDGIGHANDRYIHGRQRPIATPYVPIVYGERNANAALYGGYNVVADLRSPGRFGGYGVASERDSFIKKK